MALENFTNKLAELNDAVDKVLAVYANEAAGLDSEATAALQPTLDKLNAVINPPAPPSA